MIVWWLAAVVVTCLTCGSPALADVENEGLCTSLFDNYLAVQISDFLTDAMLALPPIHLVRRLNLKPGAKHSAVMIMLLSSAVYVPGPHWDALHLLTGR